MHRELWSKKDKVSESKGYFDEGFRDSVMKKKGLDKDLVSQLEMIKICASMIAREKRKGPFWEGTYISSNKKVPELKTARINDYGI